MDAGQLAAVRHLAHTHAGEPELPQVAARTSVRSVPIAQSYRTGVAGQSLQCRLGLRALVSGVLDGLRMVSFSSARRSA